MRNKFLFINYLVYGISLQRLEMTKPDCKENNCRRAVARDKGWEGDPTGL